MLRQLKIFTSLLSSDLGIRISLQIGFMSRVHHSILSIISFAYVTTPYMTNACIILYSACFYIKWKSFNAVCTNLVKNVLWCIINQNRQYISNTLPCLGSSSYAMMKMRWLTSTIRVYISIYCKHGHEILRKFCTFILIINLEILNIKYVLYL